MLLWITLTLVVLALAAVRYGADSRDGLDRNPFAPVGSTASEAPRAPAAGHPRLALLPTIWPRWPAPSATPNARRSHSPNA